MKFSEARVEREISVCSVFEKLRFLIFIFEQKCNRENCERSYAAIFQETEKCYRDVVFTVRILQNHSIATNGSLVLARAFHFEHTSI